MKTSLLAIATILTASFSSLAGVILTENAAAPTQNVLISNVRKPGVLDGSVNLSAYYTGKDRDPNPTYQNIGQGFRTGDSDLSMTAITWQLKSFLDGVLSKEYRIEIYKTASNDAVPQPGNLVATHAGILPSGLSLTTPFLTFTFDAPVLLQAESTYVIMFGFSEATSTDTSLQRLTLETTGYGANATNNSVVQRWVYQGYGNPENNKWVATNNGVGFGDRNQPVFFIHGEAIPEPTAIAMILGGAALLAAGRGIKKRC